MAKKGERKQFCPRGHDIFVVGRYNHGKGKCKACAKEDYEKSYIPHPATRPKVRFCPKGHDKNVVGKGKSNHCKGCLKLWREKNKSILAKKKHEYNVINKEKISEKRKLKRQQHLEEIREIERIKREPHKKQRCERQKKFREEHKEYYREYISNHRKVNINYKLADSLRTRLRLLIKNNSKVGSAVRDLGCTIEFLKTYIEAKFHSGMTWDNWGEVWELDHIKALWRFDLTNREQFLTACHYTNLQPLTVEDHKKKTAQENRERAKQRGSTNH
jgi:hypothetical protein